MGKTCFIKCFKANIWLAIGWLIGISVSADVLGAFNDTVTLAATPSERSAWFGPFFHRVEEGTATGWTLSPVISYRNQPDLDREEFDFGYPVFSYSRFGDEYRYQFLQLLAWSGGSDQTNQITKKFSLFPLIFTSRSTDPEHHYTAIGPFYGTIKHRLMRDRIEFKMFPMYSKTWKNDVITRNYFYPLVHLREGNQLQGWQVWPFYGEEEKEITVVTNRFGAAEQVPGHERQFALWPFWSRSVEGIGTTNEVRQQLILPFYNSVRSSARDSTSVLLPFGPTWTTQKEKGYFEFGFPWPLIGYARGEGKYMDRITPLFSRVSTPNARSDFYLWPLYKFNSVHSPPLDRKRTRIGLFLYSDLRQSNTETGQTFHRRDLWPLFSKREEMNGNERLQILALLEPLVPENRRVERVYAPAYSFWTSEKNAATQESRRSMLWNFCSIEQGPESKKVSLLFGIFRYQRVGDRGTCRLFSIPLGCGQR